MSKKILYLEDNENHIASVRQAVQYMPYVQLLEVHTSDEFIQRAQDSLPDLFLVDIGLKDQKEQGDDAVARLSEVPNSDKVPVLFFTVYVNENEPSLIKDPRGDFYKGAENTYYVSKELRHDPKRLATCLSSLL